MSLAPAFMVVVAFTFATAIFHTLLGVERRVWRLVWGSGDAAGVAEADIRFAHRMLKHLSGWLPAQLGAAPLHVNFMVRDTSGHVQTAPAAPCDMDAT